jgi:hypothetical protein
MVPFLFYRYRYVLQKLNKWAGYSKRSTLHLFAKPEQTKKMGPGLPFLFCRYQYVFTKVE